MHYGLAFVLLCVPVLYADNARCLFAIAQCGFPVAVHACIGQTPVFSVATGLIAEAFLALFFVVMLCNYNGKGIAENKAY